MVGIMRFRSFLLSLFAMTAILLSGCDYVAQQELQPGLSTKDDVLLKMGKPVMIWEEKDGSMTYEYPRGPEGHVTYMVKLAADGRYLGMENVLSDKYFAQVKSGMTRDELRRLLGRPTETAIFSNFQEEVWTWRHQGIHYKSRRFHVHMTMDGIVKRTDSTDDPRETGGN